MTAIFPATEFLEIDGFAHETSAPGQQRGEAYEEFSERLAVLHREHVEVFQATKGLRPSHTLAYPGFIQAPWDARPGAWAKPAYVVQRAIEIAPSYKNADRVNAQVAKCLLGWLDALPYTDDRAMLAQAAKEAGYDLTAKGVGILQYRASIAPPESLYV